MRVESFEYFDVNAYKLVALSWGLASWAFAASYLVFGVALGTSATEVGLVVGGLVFYLVASVPRRALDKQRIAQSRGSVLLSGGAGAFLGATRSKARTLLMLRSREPSLERVLERARRRVLLGFSAEEVARRASNEVVSSAATTVLKRLSSMGSDEVALEGEETLGISRSSSLGKETKIPVYMTLCFFSPVVLLLYSEFSHLVDLTSLMALFALEVVVLDLAFFVCSSEGRPG